MLRQRILLYLFVAWAGIIVLRLSQLMLFPRETVLNAVTKEAWTEGSIPAMRGRILDRNGRTLAWSERRFALYWRIPTDAAKSRQEFDLIVKAIPCCAMTKAETIAATAGRELMLNANLGPRDLEVFQLLREELTSVQVRSYVTRYHTDNRLLQRRIGEVRVVDGNEVGVSGEEKAYDELLRGRPGRYRVMVDKHGKWLKNTWEKTSGICTGYDVYLPISQDASEAKSKQP